MCVIVDRKKTRLKIVVLKLLRILIRCLYFLPIKKNRILVSSHIGKAYSCNPKYISEYLEEKYPGSYEIIWFFKKEKINGKVLPFRYISHNSIQWVYYTITAKVIIGNDGAVWIPRRKGQLIIDTWHGGGCYKKVALANKGINALSDYRTRISGSEVNLYLSSSQYFSENVIRKNFGYSGEILESGMPRNDILFQGKSIPIRIKLRTEIAKRYSFEEECFIVLYAPTWRRGIERIESLDVENLKNVVEKVTGSKVIVLGRGHHNENKIHEKNVVDVTNYSDMQELLLVADMLITDYSSSMWDFSFTGKPCFLFVPDLESYSVTPGFECDIFKWGFPVCQTNNELEYSIEHFDKNEYLRKMDEHHKMLNSYEKGNACQQVCEYINEFCNL